MGEGYVKVSLPVLGLDCYECSKIISKALSKVDGISYVEVNFMMDKVVVEFDPKKISKEDIEKAIEGLGFQLAYKDYGRRRGKLRKLILNI